MKGPRSLSFFLILVNRTCLKLTIFNQVMHAGYAIVHTLTNTDGDMNGEYIRSIGIIV